MEQQKTEVSILKGTMARDGTSVVFDLPDDDRYITSNVWLETGNMAKAESLHSEANRSTASNHDNNIAVYFHSAKGQELTKGISSMYGVSMIIIALALMMSHVLKTENVDVCDTSYFYFYMYLLSCIGILVLLILGAFDRLSNDQQYKDQKTVTFIRIGAVVLGTGGLIYEAINILVFANCPADCHFKVQLLSATAAIIFMVLEITLLLNYSRIRINKGTWLGVVGQLICMQMMATNLCVWVQTVIFETVEDIESQPEGQAASEADLWVEDDNNLTDESFNDTDRCKKGEELQHLLAPYLFPFLIEYSVVAAIMVIAIWERCGTQSHHATKSSNDQDAVSVGDSMDILDRDADETTSQTRHHSYDQLSITSFTGHSSRGVKPQKYYNNHFGFVVGWIVVCVSMVAIITYLFVIYAAVDYGETVEITVYTWDVVINLLCIVFIPLTMYRMSQLTWKDQEIKLLRNLKIHHSFKFTTAGHIHRDLDSSLLNVTFVALLIFFVFVMISAEASGSGLIFANALLSVLMGGLQTMFINWFGFHKRSTKAEHLEKKPGRQGLEIIRCCNLALWAVNTFIIKHPENKQIHKETFGFTAWVIISNITQPLTILFYFHSAACVAEIISHSYTHKYVGIRRCQSAPLGVTPGDGSFSSDRDASNCVADSEIDTKPPSSETLDIKPPSSETLDIKPPSSGRLDTKPPSSERLDTKPPSSETLDIKPPSSGRLDTKPPSSETAEISTIM